MRVRLPVRLAVASCLVAAAACGPAVDLTRDLAVTDVQTGYYNNGMKDGQHHLLPSVAFRLRNESTHDVTSVQITVQFWQNGADGEMDSRPLAGISTDALQPAAETEPFLVRSEAGYLLPDPDISTLFQNSQFKDVTVRVFARRSGRLVKIAEHQLERRILPPARPSGRP